MHINVERRVRILELLRSAGDAGMGLDSVASGLGQMHNSTAWHRLRTLIQAGHASQSRPGQPYRITAAGVAWLDTDPSLRVITDRSGRRLHAQDRGMPLRDTPSVRHVPARNGDAPRGLVNSVFALGARA